MTTFSLLLFALACTDAELALAPGDAAGADNENADTDTQFDTGDTDEDRPLVPAWYSLAAELSVAGGDADLPGAEVWLVLADADLEREDCRLAVDPLVEGTPPVGGPALLAWWELPVDAACVPEGAPARLGFGVGELSPEVRARLGTVEREDDADTLYGAWLVADGAEAFPFGYAESAGGYDDAAVPDGSLRLEPLLLVELPE